METFDLIVIGSGAAGGTAAMICRRAGQKVAIVDSRPFGGTCALRGCMPKKVLVGSAEAVDIHNRLIGTGISNKSITIDWPSLMNFKKTFTDATPASTEKSYTDAGISIYKGRARFVEKNKLEIAGSAIEAKNFIIAGGARPMDMNIPGAEYITTSDQFLELAGLPEKVVFIGGGFISFEFAHVARRAGAKVTILDRGNRPLKPFDPDLVEQMVKSSQDEGITLKRNRQVEAVEKVDDQLVVRTKSADGTPEVYTAGLVVHGAGRIPDIDDLSLEAAGVDRSRRGVVVNEYLQSVSNPEVYAAGDAAEAGPPLTPVALYQGRVAAANIISGNKIKTDYRVVPSIVFTIPPVSSVGLLEEQAKERALDYRVNHQDTTEWYTSRRVKTRYSSSKVLIDKGSDKILGAHIFGPGAEELINVFALAMRADMTANKLKEIIFAYPTPSSDIVYML